MNRYPFWKYALIAVAVAIGFLYTMPNFFPEDPAVQVSSSKTGVKLDAFLQSIEPGVILETVRTGASGIGRGERILRV